MPARHPAAERNGAAAWKFASGALKRSALCWIQRASPVTAPGGRGCVGQSSLGTSGAGSGEGSQLGGQTLPAGAAMEAPWGRGWSPKAENGMPGSTWKRILTDGVWRGPPWGRAEHTRGGRAAAGGRDGWRRRPGPDPERLPSAASVLSPQRGCFPRSRTKTAPSEGPGAAGCGVPSARSGASIAASQQQLLIKFHRGPRCTADLHALPSGLIHRTSVQFRRLDEVFILIFGLSVPQKFSFV